MHASDLLHAINSISVSIYNLKFCASLSELVETRRSIRSYIYELRTDLSAQSYILLVDGLDLAFTEHSAKFEGV